MNNYDWSGGGMAALGVLGILIWAFFTLLGLVMAVLWLLTPFAVFAIRRRVDEQQAILLRIEQRLAQLVERDRSLPPPSPPPAA